MKSEIKDGGGGDIIGLYRFYYFVREEGLREIVTKSTEEAFGLGGVDFRKRIVIDCAGCARGVSPLPR